MAWKFDEGPRKNLGVRPSVRTHPAGYVVFAILNLHSIHRYVEPTQKVITTIEIGKDWAVLYIIQQADELLQLSAMEAVYAVLSLCAIVELA